MGIWDLLRGETEKDRFAKQVMRRLKERGLSRSPVYDRDQFAIRLDEGGEYHLQHIFHDWKGFPPGEQAAQLDRALDSLTDDSPDDESFEAVADRLRPLVWNLTDLNCQRFDDIARGRPSSIQFGTPLVPPLTIVPAIDRPRSIAHVSPSQLDRWNRSGGDVVQAAIDNLAARPTTRFQRHGRGFFISDYGDFYDASRLLTPQVFDGLALRGDPVAIPISRDLLLVAGADDAKALDAMTEYAADSFGRVSRPVSCTPIVFRGNLWRPFAEEADAPELMRKLVPRQGLRDYGVQTEPLQAYLRHEGRHQQVSTLHVVDNRDGWFTWTAWTQGKAALLPLADVVVLTDAKGRALVRSWTAVATACGFGADSDIYPARFLAEAWPDAAAWAELQRAEADPRWAAGLGL